MIDDVTIRRCTSPSRKHKNTLKQRWYEMCYHEVVEWERSKGVTADDWDRMQVKGMESVENEN